MAFEDSVWICVSIRVARCVGDADIKNTLAAASIEAMDPYVASFSIDVGSGLILWCWRWLLWLLLWLRWLL